MTHYTAQEQKQLATLERTLTFMMDDVAYTLARWDAEISALAAKAGFREDQPRVPAGDPNGGQWTGDLQFSYDEEQRRMRSITLYTASKNGVKFIAKYEDFRDRTYNDEANKPTIGYGHKLLPNEYYPDGISKEKALELLAYDIKRTESGVKKFVKVNVTQNQFDALVSLSYNIGIYAFADSTLVKELNAGNYHDAANQFLVWNKIKKNGKLQISKGLSKRRENERALFTLFMEN